MHANWLKVHCLHGFQASYHPPNCRQQLHMPVVVFTAVQDFFGGKHMVLLGGSWATVDSIAGRPTFRNWYQRGQQHVFAKFRLCRAPEASM